MTIKRLKPDALLGTPFDYDTIYPFMGLNEGGRAIMGAPATPPPTGPSWPLKGFFGMGYHLFGDNLNDSFLNGWDTSDAPDGPKTLAKAALQARWANRVVPWIGFTPSSNNTCTNAALRVMNAQCYIKSAATGIWTRADVGTNNLKSVTMFPVGAFSPSDGAARRIFRGGVNIPAFAFCPTPTDWATESASTGKYRLIHGPTMARVVLTDPEDVAGIMCTFETQLISADGNSLNGTPEFLANAGADVGYDDDLEGGTGALYGAPYTPAIGGGRWSLINNDGTRRTHYFATFRHPDCYEDMSSDYRGNGGDPLLSAAEFSANMPERIYQQQL